MEVRERQYWEEFNRTDMQDYENIAESLSERIIQSIRSKVERIQD